MAKIASASTTQGSANFEVTIELPENDLTRVGMNAHSVQVELHREMKELLSGENEVGMVTLPGYGVRVYEWQG